MKKPSVNYSEFRFYKINSPEFSHLKFLLGWVGYFALYLLTENLIPHDSCHIVHAKLDDIIPFCEYFVVPYVLWYAYVALSLLYFLLYNTESFKKLSTYILLTQIIAMTVYILYPNRQDLRPDEFERSNIFTFIVGILYRFDTSTNVCPSLHVGYSVAIASVWLKEKGISSMWKIVSTVFAVLVCMSTAFIKQHSVVDIWCALIMCFVIEIIIYRKYWFKKMGL